MSIAKILSAAIAGFLSGLALAFIACVAVGVLAISTRGSARIPGLFWASASKSGNLALDFVPQWDGILLLSLLVAVASAALAAVRGNRTGSASGAGSGTR